MGINSDELPSTYYNNYIKSDKIADRNQINPKYKISESKVINECMTLENMTTTKFMTNNSDIGQSEIGYDPDKMFNQMCNEQESPQLLRKISSFEKLGSSEENKDSKSNSLVLNKDNSCDKNNKNNVNSFENISSEQGSCEVKSHNIVKNKDSVSN